MFRVDPKETSDEKRTPIRLAAEHHMSQHDEIVEMLREAIGGELPDDVKLLQLSYAMNEPDQEKFSQLLSSLPPELVGSRITYLCTLWSNLR